MKDTKLSGSWQKTQSKRIGDSSSSEHSPAEVLGDFCVGFSHLSHSGLEKTSATFSMASPKHLLNKSCLWLIKKKKKKKNKPIQEFLFPQYYKCLNTFSIRFQYSLNFFPEAHVAADKHNTLGYVTAKIISLLKETHIWLLEPKFPYYPGHIWEFLLNSDVNLFASESCRFYDLL